MKEVEQR